MTSSSFLIIHLADCDLCIAVSVKVEEELSGKERQANFRCELTKVRTPLHAVCSFLCLSAKSITENQMNTALVDSSLESVCEKHRDFLARSQ